MLVVPSSEKHGHLSDDNDANSTILSLSPTLSLSLSLSLSLTLTLFLSQCIIIPYNNDH